MLTTLLVTTYRDPDALRLILEALGAQTCGNFEVIVAEDDDSAETRELVASIAAPFDLRHVSHRKPPGTIRKAAILNRAVALARGEHLVFLDGDVIPFSTFVDAHRRLSRTKTVLCGRRVNLGERFSHDLRRGKLSALDLERTYLRRIVPILRDRGSERSHVEQGLRFAPNGLVQRALGRLDRNAHILASNFSCFREDLLAINGFDEGMRGGPGVDDTDVEWRLRAAGVTPRSAKFCANVFHLHHERTERRAIFEENLAVIREKQARREYRCRQGIAAGAGAVPQP